MEPPHIEAPHDPLCFGETIDHGLGFVREGSDEALTVARAVKTGNEGLSAGL